MTAKELSLGAAVRAWRDRVDPANVGLTPDKGRRAAGLRREELAHLAGISVDYMVRLEQGRAERPSPNVVAALARALQLTVDERDHLYRLAQLAAPGCDEISDYLPDGVQRLLSRLIDVAAAVFAADWQLIRWNQSWSALLGDPSDTPPAQRNFARDTFPTDNEGPRLCRRAITTPGRETLEIAMVSDLRRASGRFPASTRLATLISDLRNGNQRFAQVWISGTVGAHREDHKIINHPVVGVIAVDCDILSDSDAEQKIVILTTEPGSHDEVKLRQVLNPTSMS